MTEEWRVCTSWPEYEVSDLGRVRRIVRRKGYADLRKPYLSTTGYWFLVMRHPGKKKLAVGVHRLVAEAFIGPPPSPEHHIAHADGTRTNNDPGNLRWATRSENERDKVLHGRSNRGSRMGWARINEGTVLSICALLDSGARNCDIARRFKLPHEMVSSIKRGRSWAWLTKRGPAYSLNATPMFAGAA